MECGNCGTELLAGKLFCHACGTPAPPTCPQCGRVVTPGFRFCPDCGATLNGEPQAPARGESLVPLASHVPRELADRMLAVGGAMAGERKRVTVLFCDIVGSTSIAEGLDPELYHDLLEEYLALAFREIYHLDGFVNQLAGDGLMAIFGAPIPHEDAPHRAVRAALAIRDALAAFNEQRRPQGKPLLEVRIGINTGPVLVGSIGNDLKMDYSAIGDTTNVAARLQALAQPGAILISDDTHRLVRGFFAVREAGHFELKGKSEPVTAFEVQGINDATSPMAVAAARGLTPLVGRDEEMAQLTHCFDRLGGRLAQVVALVGEAGSGKSRLLYEFKNQLAEREAILLETRCSSLSQMQPYAPWDTMLRLYCGIGARDDNATACRKVSQTLRAIDESLLEIHPFLCRLIGVEAEGAEALSGEEMRRQTFSAMSELFMKLTHRAPTIMLIEDLHWIDDASREMLELAVNRIERGRFMVLVSHRPDYQPSWRTRAAFTQLYLRRLTDDQIDEIVRAVAGGPLPAELEALIRLKAEGNPFFAEEIARIVIEEGYVVRTEHRLDLTRPIAELRMPGTVEEVLGARLDRLGPHAKRVTQVAAVLGRQFNRSQLIDLLAGEDIDVPARIAELESRGILHRKTVLSDDEYRFGESLTQEVAYETLLLKERKQLHGRVAQMLAAGGEKLSAERSVLLAHHLSRSNDPAGAVRALLRAAHEAERLPSYPTAMKLYREGWKTASDALAGRSDEDLARLAVDSANGWIRMHVVYATAQDPDSEAAAVRGTELAESLGDPERVAVLTTLRGLLVMGGERPRFAEGMALVERGLGEARRAGLEQAGLGIARGLAFAYLYDGRFAEAASTIENVLHGLETVDPRGTSDLYLGSHFIAEMIYFWSDDFAKAEADARAIHPVAGEVPNRTVTSGTASILAWVLWLRGDAAEAVRWAEESLAVAEAIGNSGGMRTAAAILLAVRLRLGERVSLGRYLELIEQNYVGGGDMASKSILVVDTLLAAGEPKRARRFAEAAWSNAGGRHREALAAAGMAEALRASGEQHWPDAHRYYQRAIELAEEIGSRSTIAYAARGAGMLAQAEGRSAEGEALLGRSRDLSDQLGIAFDAGRP